MKPKIEKGFYKNRQMQYKDDNGMIFTITAIQEENFHISIQSEDGIMAIMMIPGDIWDQIAWESLTRPKTVFVREKEEVTPADISEIDVSKLFKDLELPVA